MALSVLTYLEQHSPDELRPAKEQPVEIRAVEEVSPEFARYLYTAVGGHWHWIGKLGWNWDQWVEWLSRPGFETYVPWVGGVPAGYVALRGVGSEVEIENFGLLRGFIGRGLGGHLLTVGLRQAWTLDERHADVAPITRVWVNTNTLDGPAALENYKARGLTPYKTVEEERPDADGTPPGPWPGWDGPPGVVREVPAG
ncbi:GNAT family N-acetyltransferase [Kribbella sp. NPDC005582]|uniref:GNAT family N-acetyltransferase n=1 Tax=Kribbella sp. NPDC005582 TaxID=3156893 RepID=UPI0033BC2EE1